ncbi:3-phosphoshikimate 1-carboxyvinyltransferase [Mumia flava]|uniref:3-phosphoshikimate 1-carboxyvinyltransferase n=1 Tax=Mumia flava TaxID=1348852 RepID=A0A0B2BJP8_9ACTN|nr:3-phosphoshikimate 1-carboxyvinyltransferase [Mumia flava]PJJ56493.1 3-phosphoshikimate 1-carboxyvinyltransferase [Mumia flava]
MSTQLWSAPYRPEPLDAAVSLPGSKSQTNRALVLAALADGPSRLHRPLVSRDADLMADALAALGAGIVRDAEHWTVTPAPLGQPLGAVTIDCGLAGTVMRFVPAVAALFDATTTLDGDPRARERPMGGTLDALRGLGVALDTPQGDRLPFAVHGTGTVAGGPLTIDASESSQFVSALLLVAPRFADGLDLRHAGERMPSLPHVAMTLDELRRRGVEVEEPEPARWIVRPGAVRALDAEIEPDLSNAGAFLGGVLVTGGRLRVRHWPTRTTQAGDRWRSIAVSFGAAVERDGDDLVVTATGVPRGVDLDLGDVGELTPVVAAVAALADGPSRLRGIGHLRGHETDRIAALATELRRVGCTVDEHDDGLTIVPGPLRSADLETYADHRMAHAAAVLGLAAKGTRVHDVETTAKTYPGFADDWERFAS